MKTRRKTASKLTARKRCDKLWRELILATHGHHCMKCGKDDGQMHVHHLITRARLFFRHNPNNGVVLCARCHTFDPAGSAHLAPYAFDDWMRGARPDQHAWWAKNRNATVAGQSIDYDAIAENLKEMLAEQETD